MADEESDEEPNQEEEEKEESKSEDEEDEKENLGEEAEENEEEELRGEYEENEKRFKWKDEEKGEYEEKEEVEEKEEMQEKKEMEVKEEIQEKKEMEEKEEIQEKEEMEEKEEIQEKEEMEEKEKVEVEVEEKEEVKEKEEAEEKGEDEEKGELREKYKENEEEYGKKEIFKTRSKRYFDDYKTVKESKKPSLTSIGSFDYGAQISEYFIRPKEKTPSEIQFETDYREVIEERMKKIMHKVTEEEEEKKTEEREPLQKKKILISEVDVSGLYPPPKIIESEVSFAFDEDEEIEKKISGMETEADYTKYIMEIIRDSLKHDPESIFTKNMKDDINKVKKLVEEIVMDIRKGIKINIAENVNKELINFKPNHRNIIIIRLKEKLEKAETQVETEEEERPLEVKEKSQKIKTKAIVKAHKEVEEIQEELEKEKKAEVSQEKSKEKKHIDLTIKLKMEEEKEEKREEKEVEVEQVKSEEAEEMILPYEKIDWMQFLTESEQQIAIDPKLKSEMELFISIKKAELEKEQKDIAIKKEKKLKYRKITDPQEMLKNLNLSITMKFILNTGDMFTCAYRYFMTFKEIKEDLSGIFKVPSNVLIIYRDEVEVKDDETAFDLKPEVEPFESVTFRLLTLDNDRWVLRSDHLDLPVPDIITCTVETGKDHIGISEYKDVVVEIENRKIKKPFVGGYRDRETGIEYHNAFSQSAPHLPKLPWDKRVSRDTQTAFTSTKLVNTTTDKSTQMYRRDYYINTDHDKIITPKPYVDYDRWYKQQDIEGKVKTIQRYVRAMILRKFLKKMSEEFRKRKCWEIEQEKKRILERENRIKTDIINMTYPKTKADFDMLYALVEKWRKTQVQRISNLKTEAPKKIELCTVLEKEIKLLEAIEVHRIDVTKRQKQLKALNFMKKVSKPISWTGYRGMTIEMDTLKTQRARELKNLYQSLSCHGLNYQDRIELLVSLKYAMRAHPTRVAEELSDLINQECEMLIRGVKPEDLEYLRQRIEHLFGEYFKDPNFNPEAAKYDPTFNKEPLKNNILFCKMCHQMKLTQDFSATVRDRSVNICSACQWLHNIAIPRIDLNPYRYILKTVRKDEQKRNCYSSCAFVLQDEDMRFLVANIWRNRSVVSENDNLLDLRMPRWNLNEDWTPWNCILLTELETKAHLKTRPEDNYELQLIGEIMSKHEMAKRQFQQLLSTTKRLRDSGKWANVIDVKNYQELPITGDISNLNPEECLRIKNQRAFYKVQETRRKEYGYVHYI